MIRSGIRACPGRFRALESALSESLLRPSSSRQVGCSGARERPLRAAGRAASAPRGCRPSFRTHRLGKLRRLGISYWACYFFLFLRLLYKSYCVQNNPRHYPVPKSGHGCVLLRPAPEYSLCSRRIIPQNWGGKNDFWIRLTDGSLGSRGSTAIGIVWLVTVLVTVNGNSRIRLLGVAVFCWSERIVYSWGRLGGLVAGFELVRGWVGPWRVWSGQSVQVPDPAVFSAFLDCFRL
jgi:hypothetical protein